MITERLPSKVQVDVTVMVNHWCLVVDVAMMANHYVCNGKVKGNVSLYRCELCMTAEHTNLKLNGGCN